MAETFKRKRHSITYDVRINVYWARNIQPLVFYKIYLALKSIKQVKTEFPRRYANKYLTLKISVVIVKHSALLALARKFS